MFFRAVGPRGVKLSYRSAVGNSWLSSWLNAGRQEMKHVEECTEKVRGSFEKSQWT